MGVSSNEKPTQEWSLTAAGIGPKVTQSVITAAFLFAFKDALYAYTIAARKKLALRQTR